MKTIYVTKKEIIKCLEEDLFCDFFLINEAEIAIRDYPNCKYFIYDPEHQSLKPSKRR